MDAELSRILSPEFLDDVTTASLDDLRSRRDACRAVETGLSYLRRLAQGRIDIVAGELARREEGGDPVDLGGLVERLPEILSDRSRPPAAGHLVEVADPGQVQGELVEALASINVEGHLTELAAVDVAHLEEMHARLEALERRISDLRKELFVRLDAIQGELARRYETGEASVDRLLAGE